jgi:hypothetical protein
MQNCFELPARIVLGENTAGQFFTAQTAVLAHDFPAKEPLHLGQRWLPRLNQLACDYVRIDNENAALAQDFGSGRFSHANATR